MKATRQDVLDTIAELFTQQDPDLFFAIVNRCDPSMPGREYVQLACLDISEGQVEKLREYVDAANQDFRNVLYWADLLRANPSKLADS